MININRKIITLESRIKQCANVITLGVRTNFSDYNHTEKEMLTKADTIYYPSMFYFNLFNICGKKIFPSWSNYDCAQDKIKQSTLFEMLKLPYPRTRLFYGKKQKSKILNYFQYPFIAKIPRGSAMGKGVFMILNREDLDLYLNMNHVAYIQEYLPIDRDIRVVVIGTRIIHAYWRIMRPGEFRSNVSLGASLSFDSIPPKALELALIAASKCKWNDVGIDICQHNGSFYILEANMKYGYKGFEAAGIDYFKIMEEIIKKKYI